MRGLSGEREGVMMLYCILDMNPFFVSKMSPVHFSFLRIQPACLRQ